jgi:hypothetical protein
MKAVFIESSLSFGFHRPDEDLFYRFLAYFGFHRCDEDLFYRFQPSFGLHHPDSQISQTHPNEKNSKGEYLNYLSGLGWV